MFATILAGLLGALIGAILIAAVLLVAFRVSGMEVPRFANLWTAAYLASAAVIFADAIGSEFMPGAVGAAAILIIGMTGAFIAYDRVLVTPDGVRMGRRAAVLALATHSVFSLAMFLLVFPLVMSAFV